jgi:Cu+-exporting ATPase
MTCQNCARHVGQALQSVPGVASARVNLDAGIARVGWNPEFEPDETALKEAVRAAGYTAESLSSDRPEEGHGKSGWRFNVLFGSLVTIPLMIAEWVFQVGTERWYHWASFALVLPVQVLCGARFYRGAWNQLKVGSSNMDTLVVLGSTTAFLYSSWALFQGWAGHLFFMESAAIITLISAGHWVESKVSARAARSLHHLLTLAPQTARLLGPDEAETVVPVSRLSAGDRIILKPGDRVPIDGEVLEGASSMDESMLTGESLPVDKTRGATVYTGTVNLHGWLLVRVTATGEETALAHIIEVVQQAQNSRAEIQKLGDRVSSVFVPIVVLIALATGFWWGFAPESAGRIAGFLEGFLWPAHHPQGPLAAAIYHAAAVLIIACPCAMGLATPVAIMAGTNVAAERGILVRDGMALEKTGRLTAILFDKTGTLTRGEVQVADSEEFLEDWAQPIGLQKLAASVARPSLHPLSQAIARLSSVAFRVEDWQEVRGAGVQGRLPVGEPAGTLFLLGSVHWLKESGIDLTPGSRFIGDWSERGATILGLAAGDRLLGLFALRDTVKPNALEIIRELNRQNKRVYLVTGDNKTTARAIAHQVGIPADRVFAEIRPEAKAQIVRQLQSNGEKVAFIGDGMNDAPALEQADLGIAVTRASDIAREAADILLLKSDIQAVPEALALAQATLRTVKQNLFWAFFYNAAGIPLAMFGFLSPIFSALAMGLSDLIVIGNSLRLRRWRMQKV